MKPSLVIAKSLNVLLLAILLLATLGFISFANAYGAFWAAVTLVIAGGVFKCQRWGYFASAAWALACYQLAKQEYEFESIKSWVMLAGFLVIGLSIYLHEALGRKRQSLSDGEIK
jgi:hypothetical protein